MTVRTDALRATLRGQMASLDGIRGLAILLVLAHNLDMLAPANLTVAAIDKVMDLGWVGVQLFFVLSGFLITGILLDTRHHANCYASFVARRTLRIFPLYYAVLFVAFVLVPLFIGHSLHGSEHQLWLWTYLSNWAEPFGRSVKAFPHFWSLAVEEQFYLVWPLVVLWVSPRRLVQVCIALSLVAVGTRIGLRVAGVNHEAVYMFTICRMDALAIGAAAAAMLREPGAADFVNRWSRRLGWGTFAMAMAGFAVTRGFPRATFVSQTLGYTLLAVAFTWLIVHVVLLESQRRGGLARVFSVGALRSIGKYSYGMYVFHMPLHLYVTLPFVEKLWPGELRVRYAAGYFLLLTGLSYLTAVISYHLLEKHFLRLKKHFVPGAPAPRSQVVDARLDD